MGNYNVHYSNCTCEIINSACHIKSIIELHNVVAVFKTAALTYHLKYKAPLKNSGQMTINITRACVYFCQNLLIYHNNTMKSQL